jgi:hypothetical protein
MANLDAEEPPTTDPQRKASMASCRVRLFSSVLAMSFLIVGLGFGNVFALAHLISASALVNSHADNSLRVSYMPGAPVKLTADIYTNLTTVDFRWKADYLAARWIVEVNGLQVATVNAPQHNALLTGLDRSKGLTITVFGIGYQKDVGASTTYTLAPTAATPWSNVHIGVALNSSTVTAGEKVTVIGFGFDASAVGVVKLEPAGVNVLLKTDESGNFSMAFAIPKSAGPALMSVEAMTGRLTASVPISITAPLVTTQAPAAASAHTDHSSAANSILLVALGGIGLAAIIILAAVFRRKHRRS